MYCNYSWKILRTLIFDDFEVFAKAHKIYPQKSRT